MFGHCVFQNFPTLYYVFRGKSNLVLPTMNHLGWLTGSNKECYGFRGPPFPQKLFEAMDAPRAVIQWTNNGQAISVDAEYYERNVMHVHPGLVEISSFANFRRQMREYGFDWLYHEETREFEFSHPSYVRGRPDLLSAVLTRRKRRRKHAGAGSVATGTRLQSVSMPYRRSVIKYAGVPKKGSDRPRTCSASLQTPDVGAAKSLNEMTDEEWWTYCAPAIVAGMNGIEDDAISTASPKIDNRFRFTCPLFFYCDETGDEAYRTVSRTSGGLWTERVLDFDEL